MLLRQARDDNQRVTIKKLIHAETRSRGDVVRIELLGARDNKKLRGSAFSFFTNSVH
jgi:hypothetical protein